MSYENREEDVEKCLALKIGDTYEFNIFQDNCAEILRLDDERFMLSEWKGYGSFREENEVYLKEDLRYAIDKGYDEFI